MLCPFSSLSPEDSQNNHSMAYQTLATLLVLGYQIHPPVSPSQTQLRHRELEEGRYRQSNGYLPRPLDLEGVQLEGDLAGLVDRLAENCHNVWAAARIRQGWTYGRSTVSKTIHSDVIYIVIQEAYCSIWLEVYGWSTTVGQTIDTGKRGIGNGSVSRDLTQQKCMARRGSL